MAEDTTRTSNRRLNSGASEYNAISFMMEQQMKGSINTCIPVRVDSCTKPGPNGAAGYVSATPLVMQRGADGNSLAPVSLPQLPFFRLYAGTAAVVIDPQPGDVGLAIFSQQDASNLEAGKNEPVQAGSFRSFDMSDGFYVGGFLGNVPDVYAELEQSTGINIKTPTNTITIGRDDGTITIHADTVVTVDAPIAKCSGDVEIAGTLKTGGMATFQQGLQTAAGTNASIGGSLTAANDISAGGDFSGSGGMSLGGSASIGGALDATGAASFGSTVDVTGAATFGGTLAATGAATFGGTLDATGAATFGSTFSATGAATFGSTLSTSGAITTPSLITGDITADGDISLTGDTITLDGDVEISGALDVQSITASGTVTFDGDISVTGDLAVTGEISGSGISGSIDGSSLSGNISVGSISASALTIASDGAVTIKGRSDLSYPDVTIQNGNIKCYSIMGNQDTNPHIVYITGYMGVSEGLSVGGNLSVDGDITYGGTIGPQS